MVAGVSSNLSDISIARNLKDFNMSQPASEQLKANNKKKHYAKIYDKIKSAGSLEGLTRKRGFNCE